MTEQGSAVITYAIGEHRVLVAEPAMHQLYQVIERLARTCLPVLVLGESGAGKENLAAAVHAWSPRAAAPLVALNCAALQEGLVESELFGYERGAFSGAFASKPGLLERADGGTLFLDEVNELSAAAQAKLLRVLEEGRVTRLGGVRERRVDLRVVAATNRTLADEVAAGRFRQDLYFRLGGATLLVPPLRARPREVLVLAEHFAKAAGAAAISAAAQQRLLEHPWPGNVRELKHAMEYAAALADGAAIAPWHLPETIRALRGGPRATPPSIPALSAGPPAAGFRPIAEELRDLERCRMMEALRAAGGVQRRAAELIGMPVRTFTCKLTQYGLRGEAGAGGGAGASAGERGRGSR